MVTVMVAIIFIFEISVTANVTGMVAANITVRVAVAVRITVQLK
jgi:hypothetical protein